MSLGELAAQRVGVIRAPRVLSFMVLWHLAVLDTEDWPESLSAQVRAYAKWSRDSERTVWRHLRRFREVFPEEETPTRVMAIAAAQRELSRDQTQAVWALGSITLAGV